MLRLIALASTVVLAAGSADAATAEIDAVARVTVIPQDRTDVQVRILRPSPRLPLTVKAIRSGGARVDGGVTRRIRGCRRENGQPVVQVAGLGEVAYADMPHILILTPRDVDVGAAGAVFGVVGRSASLNLADGGCGDWTAANVTGPMRISLAGSGGARTGSADSAVMRLAGAGGISTGPIRGDASVDIAGSGDVASASVGGDLDVRVAGSGDVTVAAGRVKAMTVTLAGSGGVVFQGRAESLRARVTGSGDVRVGEVTGAVRKTVIGSGHVIVGDARRFRSFPRLDPTQGSAY